jgi:dTMP kinase
VVRPALAGGQVVLCDRYADATLAYQGCGRGVPLPWLRELNGFATSGVAPDLTVLLDLPVADGLARRRDDGEWNRIDAADLAFHERVRDGYLALARDEPGRWAVVPAGGTEIEVAEVVTAEVLELLGSAL